MLGLVVTLLVIVLIADILGFGGLAGAAIGDLADFLLFTGHLSALTLK
jgi:uncharacterized membrane protein YtjA (UPF0391 family)